MKKHKHIIKEENHYHNYSLDKFLKTLLTFLIIVTVVSGFVDMIKKEVHEDYYVHQNCVNACSKERFTFSTPPEATYDRTECIESCNEVYNDNDNNS